MKILRLGSSDDIDSRVPEELRVYSVAEKLIAEAIGEPVETIVKPIWPGDHLPGQVAEWIDEFKPNLVFLKVTWAWYGYESVPRRIERIFGRVGKPVARAGLGAAKKPRLAHNRAFKLGRRMAHRLIGGDTRYSTNQVISVMEATIRRVAARENIALVVKGTGGGRRKDDDVLAGHFERFTQRRLLVEGTVERLCNQLGATYVSTGPRKTDPQRDLKGGDGLHPGATGHYWMGQQEGGAMLAGWTAFNGVAVAEPASK